ncbi:hypothetical protein R1sor_019312 [Riccia sorocarpa]|uniref:(4-O-methyl)-D-glucuronate--lignin esterase n=1 Tax=Riccia sorocarpa TaxID=122646 RepID=A0ABD3IFT2_9MARC
MGFNWENHAGEKVREEFLQVLESRRRKLNNPSWSIAGKQSKYRYRSPMQRDVTSMDPNAEEDLHAFPPSPAPELQEEKFTLLTEEGEQGRVPVLVIKPVDDDGQAKRRPVVVFLHSTGKSKDAMRASMESFAARGYITVAIDSRYHGERARGSDAYPSALIRAWATGNEMPFIFDTVWDLIKLVDYLVTRRDVDPTRIGVTGISLGGMHAWYAAVADSRIAVVVPMIAVQCFSWAVVNNRWHARVQSIPHVFEVARRELGKTAVDSEVVARVWRRIAPGLLDRFDAEHTIAAVAPRPLLILNGQADERCPVPGLERPISQAAEVYRSAGVADNFMFKAEEGVEHAISDSMLYDASVWMDRHLKPEIITWRQESTYKDSMKKEGLSFEINTDMGLGLICRAGYNFRQ